LVGWIGGPNADLIIRSSPATNLADRADNVRSNQAGGNPLDSFLLDQAITSLSQIFDVSTEYLRDRLTACHFHNWQQDPFSRGAYGYVPAGGLADQQALSQPVHQILFFAGEATSVGHIGTVHGAIMSGQRVATEILRLA